MFIMSIYLGHWCGASSSVTFILEGELNYLCRPNTFIGGGGGGQMLFKLSVEYISIIMSNN